MVKAFAKLKAKRKTDFAYENIRNIEIHIRKRYLCRNVFS